MQEQSYILIVDDDDDAREILDTILSSIGYSTRAAGGGQEALTLIRDTLPNLILLDLMMPRMSGFEVLSRLQGDPRTRRIPVIVVSALARDQAVMMHLPGVVDVIQKGMFSIADLIQRIQGALPAVPQG
ncbi:MAG: hypothetical protein Kow00124_09290 [Anaerolineae bacterium]